MKQILLLAFFSFLCQTSFAWNSQDFKQEALSPVKDSGSKSVLIWGSALTLTAVIFEEELDRSQNKIVNNRPLGDLSNIGDLAGQWIPNVAYILGQGVAGWSGNSKGSDRAIGMFKASAYAASVTTVMKYTIREPRPNEHKDRNSFPSGHTTTAFSFSGYVLAEHGWNWGIPALLLSTLSGVSRINDNRHRVHDVLAGATIGLAYGLGISRLGGSTGAVVSKYNVFPIFDEDVRGLAMTYSY